MKRLTIFLMFWWAAMSVMAQGVLCQRLDSLLRDEMFETSQVGLMVYDLTADSVVYEHNSRQLMRPASTMKLLTAITALDGLGSDYLFTTRILYTGDLVDSCLTGTLYCVGGFDPMVSDGDVNAMAGNLRAAGINRFSGTIVADHSMKEDKEYGEGWCWDDDNPRLLPLTIGRKDVFSIRLMREMEFCGIAMDDVGLNIGRCPAQAQLLCQCVRSIDEVLTRMMKMSDNFCAEAMFYQIATLSGRHPCRASAAAAQERQLLRRIGISDQAYRIADGSGLSLYNYVTAELQTLLLRYAWRNRRIYDNLLPTLPIAGVDGTLDKRMLKTSAAGNVRAKTGTLTGISSLAGYCTAANGHELAFCIINQGVMRTQTGRNFQDRVCVALCDPME